MNTLNGKVILTTLFLGVFMPGFAQVHTTGTGDVGIGMTAPAKKLHVNGDVRLQRPSSDGLSYIDIYTTANASIIHADDPANAQKSMIISVAPTSNSGTDRHIYFKAGKANGTLLTRMVIRGNGNVGVGVEAPTHKFQVAGNSKWTGPGSSYTEVSSNASGQYLRQYALDGVTQSWLIRGYSGTDGFQAIFNQGGIHVNGTVKANEINVSTSGWADYVFEEGYPLRSLEEVKAFYTRYGHLPNIPNEAEVEENGINVSELSRKYLEKIEELTLYLVQQNERIKVLEDQLGIRN